ncbi:hypothetical protein chiPu_0030174, partial [Chiloscyllium punctatum]|nr:hypothetical protein [Chiloscyllium punctatum]
GANERPGHIINVRPFPFISPKCLPEPFFPCNVELSAVTAERRGPEYLSPIRKVNLCWRMRISRCFLFLVKKCGNVQPTNWRNQHVGLTQQTRIKGRGGSGIC